jgi:hypothetical protein
VAVAVGVVVEQLFSYFLSRAGVSGGHLASVVLSLE